MSTTPPPSGQPSAPHDETTSDPSDGPDGSRSRLRAVSDLRRTTDDPLVAGVCGGVARRLDVDPVLVRVLTVVLCFVGLAGVTLYVAGWLLLSSDDGQRSLVARWFSLGTAAEQQVRDVGVVLAGVLGVLAVIGTSGWGLGDNAAFWLLVLVGLPTGFVVWIVRRATLTSASASTADADPAAPAWPSGPDTTAHLDGGTPTPPAGPPHRVIQPGPPRPPREPYSWTPTLLGLSSIAIALAVLHLVADPAWPADVALALAVLGAVLVLSTFTRGGGPLVIVGLALLPLLALSAVLPTLRTGEQVVRPTSATEVRSDYTHGVGRFELDLRGVRDPDGLIGRTIHVDTGVGETVVRVPQGTPVLVDASVDAGDLVILGEHRSGLARRIPASGTGQALTIDVDHAVGRVDVGAR